MMGCTSNIVSRQTQARFLTLGKQRARTNWSNKARKQYGWSYRKWSKAQNKGYQVDIRGEDVLLYKVRAYGTPCN